MEAGIVVINKERGYTSQDVVSKLKKILNIKKAGHIGTLDPLATGVLPVLIGNATKMSKYLIDHDKTYIATIALGTKSTTGDEEGEIIEKREVDKINLQNVEEVLKTFLGKQNQKPHRFSAVKVNGKKLYEYARNGENVEIPTRQIEIYKINCLKVDDSQKEITFEVSCSKGTYIRVLCEDIAEKLGTVGYMKNLERTKVDEFCIENSVKLDDLSEKNIISMKEFCSNKYQKIELNNRKLELFLNGVKLDVTGENGVYGIYCNKNFIGLGVVSGKLLKRDIVF